MTVANAVKKFAKGSYKVVTSAKNTGLDLAVFPFVEDAEWAGEYIETVFGASFHVVETEESANTTYGKWIAEGR